MNAMELMTVGINPVFYLMAELECQQGAEPESVVMFVQ